MSVDLPDPVCPTIPIVCPFVTSKFTPFKTCFSGTYENLTLSNLTLPKIGSASFPSNILKSLGSSMNIYTLVAATRESSSSFKLLKIALIVLIILSRFSTNADIKPIVTVTPPRLIELNPRYNNKPISVNLLINDNNSQPK